MPEDELRQNEELHAYWFDASGKGGEVNTVLIKRQDGAVQKIWRELRDLNPADLRFTTELNAAKWLRNRVPEIIGHSLSHYGDLPWKKKR